MNLVTTALPDWRDYEEQLWSEHAPDLDLSDKTIFVTGATGFIGTRLLALLAHLWRRGRGPQVLALSRDPEGFLVRNPEFLNEPWLSWLRGDLASLDLRGRSFDYLIHAAHIVPGGSASCPLSVYDATVAAGRCMLDHAASFGAARLLLVSTGGVASRNVSSTYPIAEPDDEIDWFGSNAAYCEGKRAVEALAAMYRASRGVDVIVARPFSIVGPGLPMASYYALGNFIRDALSGDEIVIQSDGKAVRSYMYVSDMVVWLLRILVSGSSGRIYNMGSDHPIVLRELAEIVRQELGSGQAVKVLGLGNQAQVQWMPRYVPDITRARTELGLEVWTDLAMSIRLAASSFVPASPRSQ